jgi:hypothetical protein
MTYVKRKRFTCKPKDILTLALRNLWLGDEILCTARTFGSIKVRVESFVRSRQGWRTDVIQSGNLRKIRRTA